MNRLALHCSKAIFYSTQKFILDGDGQDTELIVVAGNVCIKK
jgi:hypothetical protein